ncbi:DUF4870 domain-containing protein [Chitinispirillales bacterium ANBcel5]|uniref:DUF4870 domain-containing protein n=1 Tax=Cellulosispirillum alkaliphilum TaxID=3039283 RepID=UPI002A4ECB3F|nr:DUF4870 domain-containing protein [Chitinispirillales bacterium ANBcel5]
MSENQTATSLTIPQPHEITEREKEDAMGAYLMMFGALGAGLPIPFLSLIAAIIYHYLNSKTSKFVGFHSLQSLLTESIISVFNGVAVIWTIFILFTERSFNSTFYSFLLFTLFWNLIYIVFSIIACIAARKGKFYYYLVFGRLAFNHYYNPKKETPKAEMVNTPPGDF